MFKVKQALDTIATAKGSLISGAAGVTTMEVMPSGTHTMDILKMAVAIISLIPTAVTAIKSLFKKKAKKEVKA